MLNDWTPRWMLIASCIWTVCLSYLFILVVLALRAAPPSAEVISGLFGMAAAILGIAGLLLKLKTS